jgi:uncharacterized protein YggE
MAVLGDILFYSGGSHSSLMTFLRSNLDRAVTEGVDRIRATEFQAKTDDELLAFYTQARRVEPLVLLSDDAEVNVREAQIEVNDELRGGRIRVKGLHAEKLVPFTGDRGLFNLQPNSSGMNPPRGEVRGTRVVVGVGVREADVDAAMEHITGTLQNIQQCIDSQASQIAEYNAELPKVLKAAIERRRASLSSAASLAERLRQA